MTTRKRLGTAGGTAERPCTFFANAAEFRRWLEAHHESETELWMGLYKKHVPDRGLVWADAVVEALCFGWIDSVAQRLDDDAVRQRWTPRKATSNWSKINLDSVDRLLAEGRMQPAGIAAWERRRPERERVYSYEQAVTTELSPHYAAALADSAAASAFMAAATNSYRRTAIHWVMSAKQQATRDKRMAQLISDSAAGVLIPSQRYGTPPAWVTRAAAAAKSGS